jgi:hypothetical protein
MRRTDFMNDVIEFLNEKNIPTNFPIPFAEWHNQYEERPASIHAFEIFMFGKLQECRLR